MKKWSKPDISNLCVQITNDFEIEPLNSINSCNRSSEEARINKGSGCSVGNGCDYYESHNSGNGKGGKCRGEKVGDS